MIGEAVYATAVALSWVSARLSLALYYAFDQASMPAAEGAGDRQSSDGQPDEK
jgi:hypothetical protein